MLNTQVEEIFSLFVSKVPAAEFTFTWGFTAYPKLIVTAKRMGAEATKEINLREPIEPQFEELNNKIVAQSKFLGFLLDIGFDINYVLDTEYWFKSRKIDDKQYFIDSNLRIFEKAGDHVSEVRL